MAKVCAIFCLSQQREKKVQILIFVSFAKTQLMNPLEKPKYLQYKISWVQWSSAEMTYLIA